MRYFQVFSGSWADSFIGNALINNQAGSFEV